jgi:hypothetical protein
MASSAKDGIVLGLADGRARPDPRLVELARLLARRAARQWVARPGVGDDEVVE